MTEILTEQDLSAEWLTSTLRSSGSLDDATTVDSFGVEPFGEAESMMSSLIRVTPQYSDATDAPTSVIIKLASDNEMQAFVAAMFRFYEREIRFYNELHSRVAVPTPRCIVAEMYDDDRGFVLALEEVTGCRQVDQLTGLDLDDAMTCMKTLADLHAPLWGADLRDFEETMIPFDSPMLAAVIPDKIGGDWQAARERVVGALPDEIVALCDRYHQIVGDVMQDMCGQSTMAHGDFRSDNLLFDDDGNIIVLDFQLMAIANGLTDVAYCISQSVDPDCARANADALIDAYLAHLASHDIVVSRDDAMTPYKAGLIFYLSIPISMLATDGLHERAEELAMAMLTRAGAEILRVNAHTDYP